MALQFLMNEPSEDFEIWEDSPRLPKSIQDTIKNLNAEDKLKAILPYYLAEEDIMNLARAMSSIGFSPIEPLNGIARENPTSGETRIVIFDGIRRYLASRILDNPSLVVNSELKRNQLEQWRAEASEEVLESLKMIPVVKFHPLMYTLDTANMAVASAQFGGGEDVL